MASRVRTRELKSGETVAYSESAIRHNASAVEYCRTSMAALSGSTAGKFLLTTTNKPIECFFGKRNFNVRSSIIYL